MLATFKLLATDATFVKRLYLIEPCLNWMRKNISSLPNGSPSIGIRSITPSSVSSPFRGIALSHHDPEKIYKLENQVKNYYHLDYIQK